MTGFARIEADFDGGRLVWELRTVNGKGLEARFRLPPSLDSLEPELRKLVAPRLSRGNLQAGLQVSGDAPVARLSIDRARLAELCALADELVTAGHAAPPTADGLLSLRGVIDVAEPARATSEALAEAARIAFAQALDALVGSRAEEGAQIETVLARRLDEIERLVERAKADPALTVEAIGARLRAQVQLLLDANAGLDAGRLAQEAALLATRADITEELDRLEAHLAAGRALLSSREAVGRRLDFLAQEFNRESNTICSKSNAVSLTAIGMELKIVVDQFREQVQNVE